jgi:hypothetical protein
MTRSRVALFALFVLASGCLTDPGVTPAPEPRVDDTALIEDITGTHRVRDGYLDFAAGAAGADPDAKTGPGGVVIFKEQAGGYPLFRRAIDQEA